MGGDGGMDHTYDNFEHGAELDSGETVAAFKVLSIRSLIAFFTLFSWGAALYLDRGDALGQALGYSTLWGLAGMLSVALIFYAMRKLAETGTAQLSSCVGGVGTVYLDIPEEGFGEIKVAVSGVSSHVKARAAGGKALKAHTPIKVTRLLGQNSVEVDHVDATSDGQAETGA